ncbi:ABC transporter substrate-binding protein [Halopenitus sp. H-Gu1]|uniref:ABC transporter substrate-binding protein n=1 Tax=Halopenitus sp. H-Gu1 TaxID=3242697 RepID=UPI00359DE3C1
MTRDIQRRDVLKGTAGLTLVSIAGCAGVGDDSGAGTVQYGVLMPETGDLGPLGPGIRDGALLPAHQLEGETEYTIETQTGDTQTSPQAGISEANNLVNAGMPAVVGPAASNVNLQVTRQVFIPNEVVGISPSSTAPAVTDLEDDDFIFRTAPSDALQGPVMADIAVDRFEAATVGTLYLNDNYGQALEDAFVTAFEELGGEAINRVSFEAEQASYSSQLSEALTDSPDVLMVVGFPQSGITLFRDFYNEYASEYDIPILVPDGLNDSTLPEEVGNPMNNVWGTAPSASGPGSDRFSELYQDQYDTEPGVFNAHAYDAAAVIVLASVASGEGDPSGVDVRDHLRDVANPDGTEITPDNLVEGVEMAANGEAINYQGASSPVNFDENGDMKAVSYTVFRYQDGEIENVDTIDVE